jgi:hypothetical protein
MVYFTNLLSSLKQPVSLTALLRSRAVEKQQHAIAYTVFGEAV